MQSHAKNQKCRLSVVIPVINGARFLPATVRKVESYLKKSKRIAGYEIILAAQTSHDRTFEMARKLKSATVKPIFLVRKGKWLGLKAGFKHAKYPWLLMLDIDLSYPIEFLDDALNHLDSDIVIGSRYIKGAQHKNIPRLRLFLSWGYRNLARCLFALPIHDFEAGCKLIRKSIFKKIQVMDDGWIGDTELLYKAYKNSFIIREIPITYSFIKNELKIGHAVPEMLVSLLALRFRV